MDISLLNVDKKDVIGALPASESLGGLFWKNGARGCDFASRRWPSVRNRWPVPGFRSAKGRGHKPEIRR